MQHFEYQIRKGDQLSIFHFGKLVKLMHGPAAVKLLGKLERAEEPEAQRLMAAATGNYKRGNE